MNKLFYNHLALAIFSIFISSCATFTRYQHASDSLNKNRIVEYQSDCEAVTLFTTTSAVKLCLFEKDGEVVMALEYTNKKNSNRMGEVIPTDIKIYGLSGTFEKAELKTYSADEYLDRIRSDQFWESFAAGFNAGVNATNAGKSTTYSNQNVSLGGPSGIYSGAASGSSTTYDYGKQAQANNENFKTLQELGDRQETKLERTNRILLRRATLHPGQSIMGIVYADYQYNASDELQVVVPFMGEKYDFKLIVVR